MYIRYDISGVGWTSISVDFTTSPLPISPSHHLTCYSGSPTLRRRRTMAVTMSAEFVLPPDKATVWAKLNDAETLKASIPGCESLEKLSDTELQSVVKVKIGPVSARFKGKVNLTDIDAPNSYRISGQGEGGIAG